MPTVIHAYQVQVTSYFCGPAAVRVALSCQGIFTTQGQLAAELGTTVAGTDSSADVVRVLNARLSAGSYGARYIPGNDATPAQRDQLRADVHASIDAGFGLVANVVGRIVTQDGSSYNYPNGHYVTVTGYDAGNDTVFVSDVAVREYWATTAALATFIAERGYAYSLTHALTGDDGMKFFHTPDGGIYLQDGVDVASGLPILWHVASPAMWEEYVAFGYTATEVPGIDWRFWRRGEDIPAGSPTTSVGSHVHSVSFDGLSTSGPKAP